MDSFASGVRFIFALGILGCLFCLLAWVFLKAILELSGRGDFLDNFLKPYGEQSDVPQRKSEELNPPPLLVALTKDSPKKRKRHITKKVTDEVWIRYQGQCAECGSRENIELDHIIPFSKGGSNTSRNIQLLCQTCNRRKSNKIGDY